MRNGSFGAANANDSTSNDEAIARAIAESEGHSHSHTHIDIVPSAPPASRRSSTLNCPGQHGLELFQASNSQCVTCNGCRKRLRGGDPCWSCVECNFDSCESCYRRGSQSVVEPRRSANTRNRSSQRAMSSPTPNISPPVPFNNPFAANAPPEHMCLVPCTIGNITVEMLVDTGAQTSVLSMPLVTQLGLANRLDRRYQGMAAGVGRARINGRIKNVVCTFGVGHVEFLMDFTVLDVRDPLVILGLDQMRKYKCLVDMERDRLVFGGRGGVEVELLPAHQTHFDIRSLDAGCSVM